MNVTPSLTVSHQVGGPAECSLPEQEPKHDTEKGEFSFSSEDETGSPSSPSACRLYNAGRNCFPHAPMPLRDPNVTAILSVKIQKKKSAAYPYAADYRSVAFAPLRL